MIALQEELDWHCYRLYGLLPAASPHRTSSTRRRPKSRSASAPSRSCWPAAWPPAARAPTWFERHGSTPITEIPSHWPEDYRQRRPAPHRPDRTRPQHRPDRAARIQAPLEHAGLGRPGAGRAARLAARPAGVPALLARQRRPPAAAHHRQPPGRRGARRRRASCRSPRSTPATPTSTSRQLVAELVAARIRALPARAALHRHRPAQARAVGRHLGAAAPRRRRREASARSPCRPSTRARTS